MSNIGFIGGGNMASAIVFSLLDGGADPASLAVSNRSGEKLFKFTERGVYTSADNRAVAERSDIIFLAVKPQNMDEVLADIGGFVNGKTVVSLAAGVRTEKIWSALCGPLAVVRAMPNTPMLLKKGTVAVAFRDAPERVKSEITGIFSGCAKVFEVDEEQMDAVTALSGSGPACFYRIAEVLAKSAASLGLDYETAVRMAASTMAGAAEMLEKSGSTPAELIKAVSSPGGTTLAALAAFDAAGLDGALDEGLRAAEKRSRELGKR